MTEKTRIKRGRTGLLVGIAPLSMIVLAALYLLFYMPQATGISAAIAYGESASTAEAGSRQPADAGSAWTAAERRADIEALIKRAEQRSYANKMMARELLGYVRLVVVVLIFIAVAFPLTIWLLSRKRILGLSGLSPELATTLLVVEERQAKLANILKEIQGEIDYLHTMSVPDLKNLIQQAESYLKQNEADLDKAGMSRSKSETGTSQN
jgi:hypothetical protein